MLLEMVADGAGDRVVLGSRQGGFTGVGLLEAARRAAARFVASGASHVVLLDLNSEAVPITLFGAALAGLPFVPVNYRLTDDQLATILGRVTPGVVVAGEETAARVPAGMELTVVSRSDVLQPGPGDVDVPDLPWVEPEEIAVLLFTSGTTGEPKAAVLRHRHLVSYIITTVEFMGAGEDEAALVSVPP